MKKLLTLCITLVAAVVFGTAALAETSVWDGTVPETKPEGGYVVDESAKTVSISTADGLAFFAKTVNEGNSMQGYTVTLTSDIDLAGKQWTPINGFNGTFNGENSEGENTGTHVISNLYVHNDEESGQGFGLFGLSNGKVKNLTINNAHVMGNSACGAFVGKGNGLLENLHLTGTITIGTTTDQGHLPNFNSSYLGGIRGYSFQGKIKNCSVDGGENSAIVGGRQVGGILGFDSYGNPESVVECTVSNINVVGRKSIGGIVGWANSTGIKNCGITNVRVELVDAEETNTIGLISGTSWCLINDTETTVYENNMVDADSKMIVNGETPSFDNHPVLRLYSPYSSMYSSMSYVTLDEGKYMFTCYGITKAMTKGDHITLLGSSSENVTVPEGRTLTIDLNGYKLEGNINIDGTLTMKNGRANDIIVGGSGIGYIESGTYGNVTVAENGSLTITGGTFSTNVQTYCAEGYYSVHTAENEWTVLPAGSIPITMDVNSVSKTEGSADPDFSMIVGGNVAIGDNINDYFDLTRDAGEELGTYTIRAVAKSDAEIPPYYSIAANNPGALTIVHGTFTEVPAKAATTEAEGVLAHYECSVCKQWYWDAEGKNPIANHSAVVTAKLTSQTEELNSEVGKPEETFTVTAEGSATSVAVKIDTDKLMENTADTMATADSNSELKQNAVKKLADAGVTATAEEVTLILTPAVEVENVKVDEQKATITMDISLVCKVEAKVGGAVVPVAKETVPNEQIKQDTVITISVPTSWNGKSIIVRHVTKNRGVKFYSAVAADGTVTFTVPAEDGFSPFTLFVDDGKTVTVKLDSETKTYNRTDVVNETALPAASKYNYAFKGWKFEGIDGQYFNMTAELFEALLDKNAVVIGSSVFEGPLSEHPEIEEAKKNGTWGVDENKPAATAKPAAAAAVTPVRSSIPKTSDDSNLMLWVCLMGLAVLGLGGALYLKKRSNK